MKKILLIAAMAVMSVAASAQNLKWAYVDFNELIMLMPEMDEARKTIEENQETIVVPLNKTALAILDKYKDYDGEFLFPFISPQKYNYTIKEAFKKAGITRNVTWLNPQTGKEEKKSIDTLASSHMARRTFVGNLYKQVLDPNIVASMSGHEENSRAFSRYREIDKDIKTNAVNLLD